MTPRARRDARAATAVALVVAACLALAGCVVSAGDAGAGYVAGDGAVTEWAPEDRGEPIELSGVAFDGTPVDVADFRGRVVLINTWYAACPPCRVEAPDLVELDARADVQVIGVNGRDDAGSAQAFERTFGVAFPSIADGDGHAVAALQGYVALIAVPTTLVLDPEGRVAARIVGLADPSTLRALVDQAGSA